MAPVKVYVDKFVIYEDKGTYGYTISADFIESNLKIIFTLDYLEELKAQVEESKNGVSLMLTFYHFIVYVNLGYAGNTSHISFFDCQNNIDNALDIYNAFTKQGYSSLPKEQFMNKFLEIQDVYFDLKDGAELVTDFNYPHLS